MQTNGLIAIYNATSKQLYEVASKRQIDEYVGMLDDRDDIYVLENYAFIDEEVLEYMEHEDIIDAGWDKL